VAAVASTNVAFFMSEALSTFQSNSPVANSFPGARFAKGLPWNLILMNGRRALRHSHHKPRSFPPLSAFPAIS